MHGSVVALTSQAAADPCNKGTVTSLEHTRSWACAGQAGMVRYKDAVVVGSAGEEERPEELQRMVQAEMGVGETQRWKGRRSQTDEVVAEET